VFDVEKVNISPEKLQTPLFVALAVSPLFLLINRPLASLYIGKNTLFEVRGTSKHAHMNNWQRHSSFGKPLAISNPPSLISSKNDYGRSYLILSSRE
jgi:hypothetical protein